MKNRGLELANCFDVISECRRITKTLKIILSRCNDKDDELIVLSLLLRVNKVEEISRENMRKLVERKGILK